MYLNSSKIHIFPLGTPRVAEPTDKLLSEYNLRNIIKATTEINSFVISKSYSENSVFEFVIDGYYVKLEGDVSSNFSAIGNNINAVMIINKLNPDNPCIWGYDDTTNETFTGVMFVEDISNISIPEVFTNPEDYEIVSLHILSRKSASYPFSIPDSSKVRFSSTTINTSITEIDGGEHE